MRKQCTSWHTVCICCVLYYPISSFTPSSWASSALLPSVLRSCPEHFLLLFCSCSAPSKLADGRRTWCVVLLLQHLLVSGSAVSVELLVNMRKILIISACSLPYLSSSFSLVFLFYDTFLGCGVLFVFSKSKEFWVGVGSTFGSKRRTRKTLN